MFVEDGNWDGWALSGFVEKAAKSSLSILQNFPLAH